MEIELRSNERLVGLREGEIYKVCNVCRREIKEELFVRYGNNFRHTKCKVGVKKKFIKKADSFYHELHNPNATGGNKRRRIGGHGYNGGDGFVEM